MGLKVEYIDTVVVGGGQAGLAAGYYLSRHRKEFVIIDAGGRIGEAWRRRWDSLRLFTPASFNGLPGMPFPVKGKYFPTKDEMADYLESYASHFHLPVRLGIRVNELTRNGEHYLLAADKCLLKTKNVIVATGAHTIPRIPEFAARLDPAIKQLHSSEYRNPEQIGKGPVLIVGAGNSGAEIAMDLAPDRVVWLSGRDVGSIPVLGGFAYQLMKRFDVYTWPGSKLAERGRGEVTRLAAFIPKNLVRLVFDVYRVWWMSATVSQN